MKEKKPKGKNVANVDTSELLKALKATHEEEQSAESDAQQSKSDSGSDSDAQSSADAKSDDRPKVSKLAASAAAFADIFSDEAKAESPAAKAIAAFDAEAIAESEALEVISDTAADLVAQTSSENSDQAFEPALEFKETEEIFVESTTPINYVEAAEPHIPAQTGGFEEIAAAHQGELFSEAKPEEAFEEAAIDALPTELADAEAKSIIESILFASSHPVTIAVLKGLFDETNIDAEKLNHLIISLQTDYAGGDRGIELAEVAGGYQLRTKLENAPWLKRMVKGRSFRLSGPALEVLSIVAYKQPVIKSEIDQIRGVESSHLLRALMEKNIIRFAGKSELPGKPMLYATTKEFLELFGLRNIRELPTLSEIDELIPEGIGEIMEVEDGETLGTLADKMGLPQGKSYSDSENELLGITEDLASIATSTEFFEQEKRRERDRLDQERAQDLRERRIVGENLIEADSRWLSRYEAKIESLVNAAAVAKAEADAREIAEVIATETEVEAVIKNEIDA